VKGERYCITFNVGEESRLAEYLYRMALNPELNFDIEDADEVLDKIEQEG
jgi:hypothetical protein